MGGALDGGGACRWVSKTTVRGLGFGQGLDRRYLSMWEGPVGGHLDLMCQGNHSQLWRRGSYCIGARWGWGIG